MVEDIESFHAKLQVSLSIATKRNVLEYRQILIEDARIAEIESWVRPTLADARYGECRHVNGAARLRRAIDQEALQSAV